MFLYDLDIFSYRNDSLYKFDSHTIILNENDHEFDFSDVGDEDEDGNYYSIIRFDKRKEKNEVKCSGFCECFEEEDSDRRFSNLVYSSRVTSFVFVAILGWAIPKFVTDNIDGCYDKASMVLASSSSDSPISCSVENVECEEPVKVKRTRRKKEKKTERYECSGHCLTRRFINPNAVSAASNHGCEGRWAEKKVVLVEDYRFDNAGPGAVARYIYQMDYLVPFCKSIQIYYYMLVGGNYQPRKIKPCVSRNFYGTNNNIVCKRL